MVSTEFTGSLRFRYVEALGCQAVSSGAPYLGILEIKSNKKIQSIFFKEKHLNKVRGTRIFLNFVVSSAQVTKMTLKELAI